MKEVIITPWGRCFLCEEQKEATPTGTNEFPLDTICQFLDIRLDRLLKIESETNEAFDDNHKICVRLCEKCSPNSSMLNELIEEYEKTQSTLQRKLDWLKDSLAKTVSVKAPENDNAEQDPLVDTFRKTVLDKCHEKLELLSGKLPAPVPIPSPQPIPAQEPQPTTVIVSSYAVPRVSPKEEPRPAENEISQEAHHIVKEEYDADKTTPKDEQHARDILPGAPHNTSYHSPPLPAAAPVHLPEPPVESILPLDQHHHIQPFLKTEETLEYINLQPAVPYVPVTQYQYHGYYSTTTPPYHTPPGYNPPAPVVTQAYGFQPWQPNNVAYYPPPMPFPGEPQWQPQEQTYSPNSMTSFDEPPVTQVTAPPPKPVSIPEHFSENSSEMNEDSEPQPPAKQLKMVNSKSKTCPFCLKTLANRVTTHISRKHPEHHFRKLESTPMPQFAKYCDQVLKRHMDMSKAPDGEHFLCCHCRKRYNYSTDLRVHLCQHHVDVINNELHKLQT